MQFPRQHIKLIGVAASCAAIGAGASAITSAGAATSTTAQPKHAHAARLGPRHLMARAVHADLVVHTKTGFGTITIDRGAVQSVSSQQLTIKEGTPKATYKTVTLTVPANAKVRDNKQQATLADVKAGQRVVVVQAPKRTLVVAHDAKTA